jgi:hypothetical protein
VDRARPAARSLPSSQSTPDRAGSQPGAGRIERSPAGDDGQALAAGLGGLSECLEPIDVADQDDHTVGAGNQLQQLFGPGPTVLLKGFLDGDLCSDRAQVVGHDVAAVANLVRGCLEKDPGLAHGAGPQATRQFERAGTSSRPVTHAYESNRQSKTTLAGVGWRIAQDAAARNWAEWADQRWSAYDPGN